MLILKNVKCRVHKTIWARYKAGRYDETTATCSICNKSQSSNGSGENSEKRCLALLRESCPIGGNHFYDADIVIESTKFKGKTSKTKYIKNREELLVYPPFESISDFSIANSKQFESSNALPQAIYVRAVDNDNKCSTPILIYRLSNHEKLPEQFVLSVNENFNSISEKKTCDIINSELSLYAQYDSCFLYSRISGFCRYIEEGDRNVILVEQTNDVMPLRPK